MYTVSEDNMLASMIVFLEAESKTELSSILQTSRFVFEPQWEFSGIISNQKKLYASLRVPISCMKYINQNKEYLSKIACDIYIDDDAYYFLGIKGIGMLPLQTEEIEFEHKHVVLEKDSTFANFIKFIISMPNLNTLQKGIYLKRVNAGTKAICFQPQSC